MFVLATMYPCRLPSKEFSFLTRNNEIQGTGICLSLLSESSSNYQSCRKHFHFLFLDHFYHYNAKAILKYYLVFYILGYTGNRASRKRRLLVLPLYQNSHDCLLNPFLKTSLVNLFQCLSVLSTRKVFLPLNVFPTLNLPHFNLTLLLLILSAINLKRSINILLNFKPAF